MADPPASRCCRAAGIVAAALLAAACSTTGQPAQQAIWIETPDCPAASCQLRNDRGEWALPSTPGRVTVTPSLSPLEVVCRAGEFLASASAPATLPPVGASGAVAGAAIGGGATAAATTGAAAVGMAPVAALLVLYGAAIGAGTGTAVEAAMRQSGYPERIVVPLRCLPAANGSRFGFTVRGFADDDEARRAGSSAANAAWVVAVADGGRAAAAGLRPGDIVTAANGVAIDGAARLEALVRALPPRQDLVLRILRDGMAQDVRLVAP